MKFRVTWWIHGAGKVVRGSDIVRGRKLTEADIEELINADLTSIRESATTPDHFHLPNFQETHQELSYQSHYSEVANWGIFKVTKLKKAKRRLNGNGR